MDRRSPALYGHRFSHGRTARDVLSRHVSARRKIQSLRAIRHHQRQTVAEWKISATHRRLALQFFPPASGKPVINDASGRGDACSTNLAMLCIPLSLAPSMVVSPERMCRVILLKRHRRCSRTGSGTKKCSTRFAADYRDPSKKIPADIVKKMNDAKLANAGVLYRRQFAFASLDLASARSSIPKRCHTIAWRYRTRSWRKSFLPIDPSTTFVSYFGHLNGYDAGYYGYAWADAIAADMATVFEKAKDGYLDKQAGMKLRREIYEPGDSRDVNEFDRKIPGPQTIGRTISEENRHRHARQKESSSRPDTKKPDSRIGNYACTAVN